MKVNIVMLTYNNLDTATKPCLDSLYANTKEQDFNLILVDNASKDGTQDYLKQFASTKNNVQLILNKKNRGYAGGNNDGINKTLKSKEKCDFIVLLNNDLFFTPNWLQTLLHPFTQNDKIALCGPLTNYGGAEQEIIIPQVSEKNYLDKYKQYTKPNNFKYVEKVAFLCVAMNVKAIKTIGLLDENFFPCWYEDNDYCLRSLYNGYKNAVSLGSFVYHNHSQTTSQIKSENFTKSKTYYKQKHAFYLASVDELKRLKKNPIVKIISITSKMLDELRDLTRPIRRKISWKFEEISKGKK
ncbi:MAG: glycosyltransferase family 2 protein [Elusimicrobiaceae bacterium]|jgi:GT2 family glycosyltransferase|nr:glycosyltransferase family 2 protein [Elusimicrobiaceae bacterium]MBT3954931.1 glycosyltransferase family 2 protein [Elusimicrobiaceae bacterium]MBT4008581.1 glycosyltransferase family 2 protein [Elusimicrobiaceae bacterium]MBT4402981.1 glycosyltransferase family 2 protein [Elusimicrobiaceae bacterium]MBT4439747.1 glycosyltransferase family 2 protein [Elusimicrobiaceae bacterium]